MIIEDKRYEIDEVFRMIGEEYLSLDTDKGKKNSDIVVDGFRVHPISLRYMTFYQKGTACAYCGKVGTHFKLCGDPDSQRRHFNLFADDGSLITKDHPYLFNRWRNILRNDFINNNKWLIMNCTVDEYVTKAWTGGVYRDEPTEEVISEFSQYSGLDIPIARKYFNRSCANGCINKRRQPLRIKDRNALAMNMKMFGRNINHFLCKKCLMKEFGWSKSQWDEKVNEFKEQGCQLF